MVALRHPRYQQCATRPRFELLEPFTFHTAVNGYEIHSAYYTLNRAGRLTGLPGYRWDLGTMAIDDPAMVVASLEHDMLCDMVAAGELPYNVRLAIDTGLRLRLQQYSRSWVGRTWAWVRWAGVVVYRWAKH